MVTNGDYKENLGSECLMAGRPKYQSAVNKEDGNLSCCFDLVTQSHIGENTSVSILKHLLKTILPNWH